MTAPLKAAVLPCSRVGRLATRIARQSAYRARDLRPDRITVVDIGRLTPEQACIDMLREYPVVAIDGCRPKNAAVMVVGGPIRPAAVVYVADFAEAAKPWGSRKSKQSGLTQNGFNLIDAVAQATVDQVDMVLDRLRKGLWHTGQADNQAGVSGAVQSRYNRFETLLYPAVNQGKILLCCECAMTGG